MNDDKDCNQESQKSQSRCVAVTPQNFDPVQQLGQTISFLRMGDDAPISSSNISKARILTQNDGFPGSKFKQDPENYTYTQLKRWWLKLSRKRAVLTTMYLIDSIDEEKWLQAKILKENKLTRIHL